MTHTRRLLAYAAPPLAAFALVSCGGDGAETTADRGAGRSFDPQKLVEQWSGPNANARSGRVEGSLEITIEGVPEFAEPFSSSISGPFQYRKGSALPDYEIELSVRDYGLELSSVGGRSYASLGGTGYELPPSVRRRLVSKSAKGANGLTRTLEQFGVAPYRWETDLKVAGTEKIDGVEVVRINTSFNAGRQLRDANTLLGLMASLGITRATGLPSTIPASARRLIVGSVTSKVGSSWIATRDKVLRRSGFTMRFTVPKADRAALGGISGGTVVGRLRVSEVGEPQKISAPQKLAPYAELALALDALGDAQESSGGG